MTAPVGIKEVAAHAQVSVATVSNVLNRPDIEAYGFRPDPRRFTLTYRNNSFELWARRTDDSTIARAGR